VSNGYENICTNCGIVKTCICENENEFLYEVQSVNPIIEHMVTSLQYEEGMCDLINDFVHDYKTTFKLQKIDNMSEFVCAALVFQTRISNMLPYVKHFNLNLKKVSKIYDAFIGIYSLNRSDMICYICYDLCIDFKLDYNKITIEYQFFKDYNASERAIACAIVSHFFNIHVKVLTEHLSISFPASHRCLKFISNVMN
jgi:hypothetical protein